MIWPCFPPHLPVLQQTGLSCCWLNMPGMPPPQGLCTVSWNVLSSESSVTCFLPSFGLCPKITLSKRTFLTTLCKLIHLSSLFILFTQLYILLCFSVPSPALECKLYENENLTLLTTQYLENVSHMLRDDKCSLNR